MDWRTSHEHGTEQIEADSSLEPIRGETRPGSVAGPAITDLVDHTRERLWLGATLYRDLEMARRAGVRFGAGRRLTESGQ
jgi:hypothetical protein